MSTQTLTLEFGLRRINTKRSFDGECITIDRIAADDAEPERVTLSRLPGQELMLFSQQGTLLVRQGNGGWEILPKNSIALVNGHSPIEGILPRGAYTGYWVQCNHNCGSLLSNWLNERRAKSKNSNAVSILKATLPEKKTIADEITQMVFGNREVVEPRLLGGLQMLAVAASLNPTKSSLTPIPNDLAPGMLRLVNAVQSDPIQNWSLKQSSVVAGYSQFHLSRAFRVDMGYGLPEFVERCRVEMAMQKLDSKNRDMHEIAAMCGFTTASAFREALKKLLGVLPSELRRYSQEPASK